MKIVNTFLMVITTITVFASDSIPRPLRWGFKLNYEVIRTVPQYLYTVDNLKETRYTTTFLNFGFGFQVYEKNQRNYHEISLSRLWHSNSAEGYRDIGVKQLDPSNMIRNNNNFQIGFRYSYYLQTSSKNKVKPHKFLLEFPIEVFYHSNSAQWYQDTFPAFYVPYEDYRSDVIGFSVGITPHYHYSIGERAFLDLAIPVAYTGMYCFTTGTSSDGTDYVDKRGSGYISGNLDIFPVSYRLTLGVKLYARKKRKI